VYKILSSVNVLIQIHFSKELGIRNQKEGLGQNSLIENPSGQRILQEGILKELK